MARKGITGGSLGTYETSPTWRKRQRERARRYEEYCKRKSGPVKTTKIGLRKTKINILEQKLAKATRDKTLRADAAKRLRYLQTCLMRLTLALSTHAGDAEEYLNLVANFPFDEGYAIIQEAGCVIAKSDSSKHLCLKAVASESKLTLGLSGGKSYWIHRVEATCCDEYIGRTWHITDLW